MNAREHEYRLSLELRQVNDVLSCLLHSLLLHRTSAKFCYSNDCNYSLGSLGITEVDCPYVDLTYVRLNSQELFHKVDENIKTFRTDLETNAFSSPRRTPVGSPIETAVPLMVTSFGMEFFQIKRRSWPLSHENNTWERWNIVLDIFKVATLDEFSRMKETVAESLSDIILNMCSTINRPQYLPKMPTRVELENVYDTSISDCQPYNFRFLRPKTTAMQHQSSFNRVSRIFKDLVV